MARLPYHDKLTTEERLKDAVYVLLYDRGGERGPYILQQALKLGAQAVLDHYVDKESHGMVIVTTVQRQLPADPVPSDELKAKMLAVGRMVNTPSPSNSEDMEAIAEVFANAWPIVTDALRRHFGSEDEFERFEADLKAKYGERNKDLKAV